MKDGAALVCNLDATTVAGGAGAFVLRVGEVAAGLRRATLLLLLQDWLLASLAA